MKVQVRFFAITREKAGLAEDTYELAEGATLHDLWDAIADRHPPLDPLRHHLRLALNLEYANGDALLSEGDEVALIPPVAGGVDMCTLSDAPIDILAVRRRVERAEAGAIATFEGVVRNHSKGKKVSHLEYEVYPQMALPKLREVVLEVEAAHPESVVAVEHRFGQLIVGDTAVFIAVSSPHRAEAFAACQMTIDRIKEIVPIWKKEFSPDGSHWVGFGS